MIPSAGDIAAMAASAQLAVAAQLAVNDALEQKEPEPDAVQ